MFCFWMKPCSCNKLVGCCLTALLKAPIMFGMPLSKSYQLIICRLPVLLPAPVSLTMGLSTSSDSGVSIPSSCASSDRLRPICSHCGETHEHNMSLREKGMLSMSRPRTCQYRVLKPLSQSSNSVVEPGYSFSNSLKISSFFNSKYEWSLIILIDQPMNPIKRKPKNFLHTNIFWYYSYQDFVYS